MLDASPSRPDRSETRLGSSAVRAWERAIVPSHCPPRRPRDWPATGSDGADILAYRVEASDVPSSIARCDALLVQVLPTDRPVAERDRPQPGDVLLVDLRQPHAIAVSPGAVHITLPGALLGEIAACFRCGRANPLDALTEACGRRLNDATIRDLALRACATLVRADRGATVFRNQLGRALAAHLLATYATFADAVEPARGGLAPWQLKRAQDRMRDALAQSLSLPSVAAACGLSPSHFARAFRCSTGVSPHAWLVRQRLARAKDLMRAQDLSLADIALACGFADQSHFTRVFAREEAMSPGRWRRSIERDSAAC